MRSLIGQLAVYTTGAVIAIGIVPSGPIGVAAAIAMILMGLKALWEYEKARSTQ